MVSTSAVGTVDRRGAPVVSAHDPPETGGHRDTEHVALTDQRFRASVVADPHFAAECGGPDRLARDIAAALGAPEDRELPLRLAFQHGWGEDYRTVVAYVYCQDDQVVVRGFRHGDPVANRAPFPRSMTIGR